MSRRVASGTRPSADGGSVAAELAIAMPMVVLVLVIGVGALTASSVQLRLQDAAADAARIVARGEDGTRASDVVGAAVTGAASRVEFRGDLVCVVATATVRIGVTVPIEAASCALAGGR